MDLSDSIAPRSDQINADDLISGPKTITITGVKAGEAEQPVDIIVAETPGRVYRPSKSMRRIIVAAWGADSSAYVGRRLTIFRNPDITFGRDKVGGIQISHMSHIDKPLTVALTVTRGKRSPFTVKPLADPVARDWRAEADALDDVDALKALYRAAPEEHHEYIAQRGTAVREAQEAMV